MPDFAMAWLDCEFGGLNPREHDITEIAVIVTDDRLVELDSKEWKIRARPERISAEAAKISGYTEEAWANALPIRQVLTEFAEMMPRGKAVVPSGQNVRMDVQFIELTYESCEIPYPFDYHVIDLATLFYSWALVTGDGVSALSLRQAAVTAGLIQGQVPHRAMADARLTLETFRHYVGQLAPRAPADAPPVNPIAHMEGEPR